ncbi:MAG: MarR family transcriptional regulator, partial [Lachnospiraceae bacterium]
YLADLASEMNLSIPDTSRAVKKLQEKGYVSWMLDENKEKTYIALTKNAVEMSERQKEKIASAYEKIVSEISKEDLETTVRTLASISKMIGTGN